MVNLQEIYKPSSIEEATELCKRPGTVALAGGTALLAHPSPDVQAVVDLSNLGLNYIRDESGAICIGATTTLAELVESPMLRAAANGVVARAAHRSAASILRNQATVLGTLLVEPAGILATVLLALGVRVLFAPPLESGEQDIGLADLLERREEWLVGRLFSGVLIPAEALGRRAVLETVGRTPADKPIVSVCVALPPASDPTGDAAIALGGVAKVAIRASNAERMLTNQALTAGLIETVAREASENLAPAGDFKGSAEYRRELAKVLVTRALRELK